MIRSMTGFGQAQLEIDNNAYHVEIRTVNNRYFKTSIRLPEDLAFIETELERMLRQRITRGTVSYRLFVRDLSADAAYDLNAAALEAYVRQLQAVADRIAAAATTIDLATLSTLPGVCQPPELTEADREARWKTAAELTERALDDLLRMRQVEGDALARDLSGHCAVLRDCLTRVRGRVPEVLAEYHQRLQERVQALVAKQGLTLASEDLAREVAIYADRSDISEEIARLSGHIEQFEAGLRDEEAAGRKLEFIAQEMLREANTMGSKSGDAELSRAIIEMKSAIDRIKEQVQNAE